MSIAVVRNFFLWCTVVDYGFLMFWLLAFKFGHDWIQSLHSRWFRLSSDQFDALHYGGMTIFKTGIILFNLTPCIVLFIVGNS